jgi:hypothetical protein
MRTDFNIYKNFEVGATRVLIIYDPNPTHPWNFSDRASGLAFWREGMWMGSFLPHYSKLIDPTMLFTDRDELASFLDCRRQEKGPYVIKGIRWRYDQLWIADEEFNINDETVNGAILTTKDWFQRFVDSSPMSNKKMLERMDKIVRHNFKDLRAWAEGNVFSYIVEKKCPTCDHWVEAYDRNSCGNFYMPDDGMTSMFRVMADHWNPLEGQHAKDLLEIKQQMGILL